MSNRPQIPYRMSLPVRVEEILWDAWDPIWVNDSAGAEFEYERYVVMTTDKLRRGADVPQITELLDEMAFTRMRIRKDKLPPGHHEKVAQMLVSAAEDVRGYNSARNYSELRGEVAMANHGLPVAGLVTMHSGNASGYDPKAGTLVIKASGMNYERVTPYNLVEVRVADGKPLHDGPKGAKQLRPSVDLPHHLYLYRHIEGVRSVIHTHSNYATAFAAVGKPIPLVLTAIADEFGAEIPCAPYVDNEGEHIGEAILKYRNRAPAILMGNHGVFAWGDSPKAALKAAVMVEDVAKTVWLAMQIGTPREIPAEEAEKWFDRYQNRYGQD